jgi:hypothetical protein
VSEIVLEPAIVSAAATGATANAKNDTINTTESPTFLVILFMIHSSLSKKMLDVRFTPHI